MALPPHAHANLSHLAPRASAALEVEWVELQLGLRAYFHRTDEEKNRGVVGFVAWDGKDDAGNRVPDDRFLWRMEFDFGEDRILRFRADIPLP